MNKMHNYEPHATEEGYQVLIAEYHHALCGIKDYFKQADRKLVLKLVDDTRCKQLRIQQPKMLKTERSVLTLESQQKIL